MHVDICIGPCHNLLKGAKMWEFGSSGVTDSDDHVAVGISVSGDYDRKEEEHQNKNNLLFIPLSNFEDSNPNKKETRSCGGT